MKKKLKSMHLNELLFIYKKKILFFFTTSWICLEIKKNKQGTKRKTSHVLICERQKVAFIKIESEIMVTTSEAGAIKKKGQGHS